MTRVKICGLTRREDVTLAARLGADALGFVFAGHGPRALTVQAARDLTAVAPPWVNRVGVFAEAQRREAPAIAEACRIDTLQLLGAPDPAYCAYYRGRFTILAALGVDAAEPDRQKLQDDIRAIAPHVDGILLDTAKTGMLGGTGTPFDWGVLDGLESPAPLIVAGGLGPSNLAQLLGRAKPWGVDVSSGVEAEPGLKDPDKLRRFIELARG